MTLVLRSGPLWERPSAGKRLRLVSSKHRAGSNIPRSAHPSAVRGYRTCVAFATSGGSAWLPTHGDYRRTGLTQGDARPQDQDLPAAEPPCYRSRKGRSLRRASTTSSPAQRGRPSVAHCGHARPHDCPQPSPRVGQGGWARFGPLLATFRTSRDVRLGTHVRHQSPYRPDVPLSHSRDRCCDFGLNGRVGQRC